MLFDDRLATVLRSHTGSERAARTQFRQLLDLLGSAAFAAPGDLTGAAYARLSALAEAIPPEEQSRILREPGLRLRNRQLVAFLAEGETKPAAAALATAQLGEDDWITLIPELPIVARGFLRHRRNLPGSAKQVLERLGVRDLVLPQPARETVWEPVPPAKPASRANPEPRSTREPEQVRSLLRRIEAFHEGRKFGASALRLPLGDAPEDAAGDTLEQFEFTSDAEGRIDWASADLAPLVIGLRLARPAPGIIAALEEDAARRMHQFQPLKNARLAIDGAPAIAGEWRVDAEPVFAQAGGRFTGYSGRIRRPVYDEQESAATDESEADRIRQLLHELRTPVNAIQGFAEIIQQQLFGPAPNEYRALAAAVAVDSAKLLAGFDEVDRLTRLETGAIELDRGDADMRPALLDTIQRLEGVLRSRNAGFDLQVSGSPFETGLIRDDLLLLLWRILASIAGSAAPGEKLLVRLGREAEHITLSVELPQALALQEDKFIARAQEPRPAISAGMFGTGFAFRLARAEVQAAGGSFAFEGHDLAITLPLLTRPEANPSNDEWDGRVTGT